MAGVLFPLPSEEKLEQRKALWDALFEKYGNDTSEELDPDFTFSDDDFSDDDANDEGSGDPNQAEVANDAAEMEDNYDPLEEYKKLQPVIRLRDITKDVWNMEKFDSERSIQVRPGGITAKESKTAQRISHVVERTPTSEAKVSCERKRNTQRALTYTVEPAVGINGTSAINALSQFQGAGVPIYEECVTTTTTTTRSYKALHNVAIGAGSGYLPSFVNGQLMGSDGLPLSVDNLYPSAFLNPLAETATPAPLKVNKRRHSTMDVTAPISTIKKRRNSADVWEKRTGDDSQRDARAKSVMPSKRNTFKKVTPLKTVRLEKCVNQTVPKGDATLFNTNKASGQQKKQHNETGTAPREAKSHEAPRDKKNRGSAISTPSTNQERDEPNLIRTPRVTLTRLNREMGETPKTSRKTSSKSHHKHAKPYTADPAVDSTEIYSPIQEHANVSEEFDGISLESPRTSLTERVEKRVSKVRPADGSSGKSARKTHAQACAEEPPFTPSTSSSHVTDGNSEPSNTTNLIEPGACLLYTPGSNKIKRGHIATITPDVFLRKLSVAIPDCNITLTQDVKHVYYVHGENKKNIETEPGVDFLQTQSFTYEPMFAAELIYDPEHK